MFIMVVLRLLVLVVFFLMIRRPPISTLTHSFPTRRSSDLLDGGDLQHLAAGRPAGLFRKRVPLGCARLCLHPPADAAAAAWCARHDLLGAGLDRKSTRLNSSH